jgi:hypothetical protein
MDSFRVGTIEILSNFQLSGFMRFVPDILGLRSWEQYKDMDFSKYDLIWIHMNPRIMTPAWYDYPKLIRARAPKAILVGSHEYEPQFYQQDGPFIDLSVCRMHIPPVIKKGFDYLDYWVSSNKPSWEFLKDYLTIPVLYAHISEPKVEEEEWLPPLPWEDRNGVFTISHSVVLPMTRKFGIIKDVELSSSIISTNKIDKTLKHLEEMAMAFQISNIKCYETLPWLEYTDVYRHNKVAFDIDYIGVCRMAHEGAKLGVPTVGTNLMEYRTMLYPELTVNTPEEMVEKILEVHADGDKAKHLNNYANMIIREYWSKEAVETRTKKLLSKMGVSF